MENLSIGILLLHSQTHSRDTDVVVIGVAVFDDLNVDHLWMIFGKAKDLRWIPIQHLTLHWLNLPIEATHTQDEGFERDSRDQTCSLVFVGSVDLVLISLFVQPFCKKVYSQRLQLTT
jgi:hypothetical protein